MPEILTIIIYVLLIILIIVAIAIGIKLYVTLSKVNVLVDDVTQKVKSLDRVFEIVDVVNDKVAMIGETAVGLLSGVVKKIFKNRKKYKYESEEEEDE